jgi:hypothetical protein
MSETNRGILVRRHPLTKATRGFAGKPEEAVRQRENRNYYQMLVIENHGNLSRAT